MQSRDIQSLGVGLLIMGLVLELGWFLAIVAIAAIREKN